MQLRNRYSIRFLLLITAAVAIFLAAIEFRPKPKIIVTFQTSETVTIDEESVDVNKLRSAIEQARVWRKLWLQESNVVIFLPESILADEDYLLEDTETVSIQELMNPTQRKQVIRAWDVADFLEKHNLSNLDDFVVGGVNPDINSKATAR